MSMNGYFLLKVLTDCYVFDTLMMQRLSKIKVFYKIYSLWFYLLENNSKQISNLSILLLKMFISKSLNMVEQ